MLRDLRHAIHTLGRSPGYTLLSIVVLALGIGANAAIFSVLDSVVLHALPYPDPGRLVFVWERFPALPPPMGPRMFVARSNFTEWQRQATVFSRMAAFTSRTVDETSSGHPRHVDTGYASAALFPLLGAEARLGRLLPADTGRAGNDGVAVLTDAFFDREFQRNPAAIGRTLTLDGAAYTVIGVLPAGFHLPATHNGSDQLRPEVWVPLSRLPATAEQDHMRTLRVVARLKPGATLAQARTEMDAIAQRLQKSDPGFDNGWLTSVFDFRTEDTDPKVHRALFVLMTATGLLLLIACANLANLTVARATLRARELALRLALGATRARLISQLIAEPFLLSLAGAACGLLLARWGVKLIVAYKPEDVMRPELIAINLPVLLFAALAGVATTILFGLAPAFTASRADLNTTLKSGGAGGASAMRLRSRQLLIALEVALALVLVSGAGLMIRSFQELLALGVGFRTDRVTLADIDLPAARYPDDAARARFFRELEARAAAAPGINAAAIVDNPPLHRISMSNFYIEGRPEPPLNALPIADKDHMSPGYFDLIGLRIEAGRAFTDTDLAVTEKGPNAVVIVNRAFARQFFPNQNPIGQRLLRPRQKAGQRDHRDRLRFPPHGSGERYPRHHLLARPAAPHRQPDGAQFGAAGNARRLHPRPGLVAGQGSARGRGAAHDLLRRRVALPAAFQHLPARRLRRAGADPGHARDLRSAGRPGGVARARNRHPHGDWRHARADRRARAGTEHDAGSRGARRRARRQPRARPLPRIPAVPGAPARPLDARPRPGGGAGGSAPRRVGAAAPRDPCRLHRRPSRRVTGTADTGSAGLRPAQGEPRSLMDRAQVERRALPVHPQRGSCFSSVGNIAFTNATALRVAAALSPSFTGTTTFTSAESLR